MTPKLSRRTAWPLEPSPLHRAIVHAREVGRPLLDLSVSDPTAVGLLHPDSVYEQLGTSDSRHYRPRPFGLESARRAVCEYYARRDIRIEPDQVWLCASTSEAYAHLFALLCDHGDTVLVPRPGYPLLDHLADLAGIRLAGYPSTYDARWWLDVDELRRTASTPGARALLAVTPNNPTGSSLSAPERTVLEQIASERGFPLLVDEVFADYPLDTAHIERFVPSGLVGFLLSGLSKVACLPQLKLSWVIMLGSPGDRAAVAARAEVIADTFLSVTTPVQLALPRLLQSAETMQDAVRARIGSNLGDLDARLQGTATQRLAADGGWTALVRLPALGDLDDAAWALTILERTDVVVQPGYLFDLTGPPCIAISLLQRPELFAAGVDRIVDVVERLCR